MYPSKKMTKITNQFCIKIYLNYNIQRHLWFDEILSFKNTVFDNNTLNSTLPILHVNAFLNNRIVISVSNRSKCVFFQNRNTNSNFVNVNKIGNQALYKAIC